MAMAITRRDIDRAHAMVRSQQVKAERAQAKQESYMGQLMQSAEVGAGALAGGVMYGRYGAASIGPVPLNLLAGLAIHALGFSGLAGKYSADAHNIGDGVLASYLVTLGAGLGVTWANMVPGRAAANQAVTLTGDDTSAYAPAAQFAPPMPVGAYGAGFPYGNAWAQGGGLSEADLAAMAALG